MNRLIALAAMAGSCFVPLGCATQESLLGLVVSDVTVISPERAAPLEHAFVRILEGRIAEVSERPLRGEQAIDGMGRYLIPGLIDSHAHLAVPPGFPSAMTVQQAAAHPEIVAAALAQDPKSYLFFGFTTLVDLVGSGQRTAQWNALDVRPDAYFCGAAVIIDHQIRFAHFPRFSYDVAPDEWIPPVIDPAQHTPDAVAARLAADGAICMKTVYEEFAGMTPTVDEAKALVAAAHAHGMPVFIHANRKRAQAFALAAGVDVIAHGMWRNPNEEPGLDDEAREILAGIARHNIGYQPTTQVIVGELDMLDSNYLARLDVADVYPRAFIEWCASEKGACGAGRFNNPGVNAEARFRGTISRASEVTRVLAGANAQLMFGSDTPSDMLYTNPPGLNGRLEMRNWIAAGVSEEKLFRALTIDNARMLRLDRQIGTVEPGKTANLLLLRGDPLRSVDAYDTIETVFLHGRPIPRATLSARNASQ